MASFATFSLTNGEAMAALERGEMIPWEGVIVIEGIDSGDFRQIEPGALTWRELPLPLMAMFENPVNGSGHDGAQLAGRIDTIERLDEVKLFATGFIDPTAPAGPTLVRALDHNLMRGVSVDLDSIAFVNCGSRAGGPPKRLITTGRVSGVTATPFQAFMEATIGLSISDESNEALAASGSTRVTARVWTPIDPTEALVASASRFPVDPPAAWFEKMAVDVETPLTITPEGRVFGHVATWGACHIAFGKCEPVPRSRTNYAGFRTGSTLTAEGTTVRTGPIVMDTVHPDLRWKASDAQAFYADTGCAAADVIPYEDKIGIFVVGAMRPSVTPENVRAFRGSDISPDWRTINGQRRECCALLAVNNSGFKQMTALAASGGALASEAGDAMALYDADGEVEAMVASGSSILATEDCGCDEMATDDPADPTELDEPTEEQIDDDRRAAAQAALQEAFWPKVRTFAAARTFDEGKMGKKLKTTNARAGAPTIQEDDVPGKSPTGAKLVDFNRDGGPAGVAVYEDGAVYDGKGWQPGSRSRRFGKPS